MMSLGPLFTIAGIAASTLLLEHILKVTGHGDKVVFVNVLGYGGVAVYTFQTWFEYIHQVASMFNVIL